MRALTNTDSGPTATDGTTLARTSVGDRNRKGGRSTRCGRPSFCGDADLYLRHHNSQARMPNFMTVNEHPTAARIAQERANAARQPVTILRRRAGAVDIVYGAIPAEAALTFYPERAPGGNAARKDC